MMDDPTIQIQDQSVASTEEIHYLKEDAIYFYTVPRKTRGAVPPPTPECNGTYDRTFQRLPDFQMHRLQEVPQVSTCGIKFSIQKLGQIFGLNNYEYDLIQFWFLDILTDCLWKAQDMFQFDLQQQRIILNWVTSIFKIIADPVINISRKDFLVLFKNVIFKIYRTINNKNEMFPKPDIMQEFIKIDVINSGRSDESYGPEGSDLSSSRDNASLSTFTIKSTDKLVINPEFDIKAHIEMLKTHNPLVNIYQKYENYYPSETELSNLQIDEGDADEEAPAEETTRKDTHDANSDATFYKADYSTPTRFQSSYNNFTISQPPCVCKYGPGNYCICVNDYLTQGEYHDEYFDFFQRDQPTSPQPPSKFSKAYNSTETQSESTQILNYLSRDESVGHPPPSHADFFTDDPSVRQEHEMTEEELELQREQDVLKEWAYFKLMEQRCSDMDDPKVGWIPWLSFHPTTTTTGAGVKTIKDIKFSDIHTPGRESFESSEINTERSSQYNMLKSIVDFTFEYYYESFHFTLIKLAFRSTPNIITQNINDDYKTPKLLKQEFQRPKPTLKKESKKDKKGGAGTPRKSKGEKKGGKKAKSDKADKKSSTKTKSDRKSVSSKKSKGRKSVKSKSEKKSKASKESKKAKGDRAEKPKKKILTAEERLLLERQRLEEALLEQERIKKEEYKVFMCPLADAASENLFLSIFENWVNLTKSKQYKDSKMQMQDKKVRKKR